MDVAARNDRIGDAELGQDSGQAPVRVAHPEEWMTARVYSRYDLSGCSIATQYRRIIQNVEDIRL